MAEMGIRGNRREGKDSMCGGGEGWEGWWEAYTKGKKYFST